MKKIVKGLYFKEVKNKSLYTSANNTNNIANEG